jgi:hypothetical protein
MSTRSLPLPDDKAVAMSVSTFELLVRRLRAQGYAIPDDMALQINQPVRGLGEVAEWPEWAWAAASGDGEVVIGSRYSVVELLAVPFCEVDESGDGLDLSPISLRPRSLARARAR